MKIKIDDVDERQRRPGRPKSGEVRADSKRVEVLLPLDLVRLMDLESESRGVIIRRALKLYFALKSRGKY